MNFLNLFLLLCLISILLYFTIKANTTSPSFKTHQKNKNVVTKQIKITFINLKKTNLLLLCPYFLVFLPIKFSFLLKNIKENQTHFKYVEKKDKIIIFELEFDYRNQE